MTTFAPKSVVGFVGGILAIVANTLGHAADESPPKCASPLKPIGKLGKYMPVTAILPDGTVHVEFTVSTDGLVRDVAIVKSSDERLEAWALVKATDMKYAPVATPCRVTAALRHRNPAHPDGIESAANKR